MLLLRLFTLFPLIMFGLFIIFTPLLLFQSATATTFPSSSGYGRRYGSLGARSLRSMAMPPVAKKMRHEMEMFGDVRVDDYYWLRDDSHSNPEVLSYLHAENNYTEQVMSSFKQFENQLYAEMTSRFNEDYISVPIQRGAYFYYWRSLKGKDYDLYCRHLITNDSSSSTFDVMLTGPKSLDEEVILDVNILAQGHDYYYIGDLKHSPNNTLIAYSEDINGDEIYNIKIINTEKGNPIGNHLKGTTSNIEWAKNNTLIYGTWDEFHRSYKVWSHQLLSNQSSDHCLYHEKDDKFALYFYISESKKYIFVGSSSWNATNMFYLDISKQEDKLMTLIPRVSGMDAFPASHRGNHFFVMRRNEESYNYEIIAFPIGNPSKIKVLIQHRERVKITDFLLFINHIAVQERENGLSKITIYSLPPLGEPLRPLQDGRVIDFVDPMCTVALEKSEFSSSILRFYYSSMKIPPSIYDYDMNLGISVLKQRQQVLGGFKSHDYLTERKWATSSDGTKVPISILYKKNIVKLDGSAPLLLYGYGSFGVSIDPSFSESRLSLVDRGFIYAIAHIRGGGEMGRKWYEDGKLLKKNNSFTDFIACAEFLIENKYCSKEKLSIHGRSAGGLLIGVVLNMRPDLFKAAIAGVPYVDLLTDLLDPTVPLTTTNWEQFGDPRKEEYYYYLKSYSPIDNIRMQNYPNLLVTAGLNDWRVLYSDPAKYVAKLRATKADNNILLFKCDFGSGHFSRSGRTQELQDAAFTNAFLLKALNIAPSIPSS